MKRLVILLLLSCCVIAAKAQQDTSSTGTITVKKKASRKTLYDHVNSQLVLIDQYGKVLDSSQVVPFDMVISIPGSITTYSANGAFLTHEMKQQLQAVTNGTVIYFKSIKARTLKVR